MLLACCASRTQRRDDVLKPAPPRDHDRDSHTAAQLSREQKLRADPLADVLGPEAAVTSSSLQVPMTHFIGESTANAALIRAPTSACAPIPLTFSHFAAS